MAQLVKARPFDAILPVFGLGDGGRPQAFLGTGFFVGEKCLFATAHHVPAKWTGDIGVVVLPDTSNAYRADPLRSDPDTDLALFQVPGYRPRAWLALGADADVVQNQLIVCYEYGTTRTVGRQIQVSFATRLGNITRHFSNLDVFGKAGENALELSFPALEGASGAPIMTNPGFLVLGVLKANVSYHLIPVEIERVEDIEGKVKEETRFMLPQAIAIHVRHLREILAADAPP